MSSRCQLPRVSGPASTVTIPTVLGGKKLYDIAKSGEVHCITGSCGSLLWPDLLVATALFLILMPGLFLNIPPVPVDAGKVTLSQRLFFTKEVNIPSAIVHTLIFFILFGLYKKMSLKKHGIC